MSPTATIAAPLAPESEAELSQAVRDARAPLRVEGGGTRGQGGDGAVLSTRRLTGIELYEPGALTIVVRAGTPVAEVEAALAAEGQRLAFEPMDHRPLLGTTGEPTIGGVAAANVSGPRRIQVGAARDFLLGVRFVDGTGEVVKNGGRVMKNVTGYDLVRLMAGSRGALGVLTQVALKVLPAPAAAATLTLDGLDIPTAIRAMTYALGSPFEVTGAAHEPGGATRLRIEGFADSVAYRAGRLSERLAPFGPVSVERDPDAVAATWAGIRDARPLAEAGPDIWRISVKPTDGAAVAGRLPEAQLLLDWGGGLVWAATAAGTDLRAALDGIPGHATLVRTAPVTRARLGTLHPQAPAHSALTRGLKSRFDPRGVFAAEET